MKIISILSLIFFVSQITPTFSMNEEEINLAKVKHVAKNGALNAPKKYVNENSFIHSNQDDAGGTDGYMTASYEEWEKSAKYEASKKLSSRDNFVEHNIDSNHSRGPSALNSKTQDGLSEAENCCTHWGLKRWVYGIKEYVIDRCLFCTQCNFNPMDEERVYESIDKSFYSDCCCVSLCGQINCDSYFFNNPIGGTLCFPLAATMHLLCLPFACCASNEEDGIFGPTQRRRDAEKKEEEEKLKTYRCTYNYEASKSYSNTYGYGSNNNIYDTNRDAIHRSMMDRAYWYNSPLNLLGPMSFPKL